MIDESSLRSIEKLHEMHSNGILSDSEFEEAKRKILTGGKSGQPRLQTTPESLELPSDDDFLAWMLLPLKRYVEFTGRSSRREFWMFLLFLNLATLAFMMLGVVIGFPLTLGLWVLGLLGVLVPYIAVEVRRFHDQGRSGWFALINLVPYIGAFIVLVMMALPGTEGENEYGHDPLN